MRSDVIEDSRVYEGPQSRAIRNILCPSLIMDRLNAGSRNVSISVSGNEINLHESRVTVTTKLCLVDAAPRRAQNIQGGRDGPQTCAELDDESPEN